MRLDLASAQLRLSHVAQNLLLFVPVITSHRFFDGAAWISALAAAISFSLLAIGLYQLNDILDKPTDTAHETRGLRPYAAGHVGRAAVLLAAVLFAGGALVIAAVAVPSVLPVLVAYLLLGMAYSAILKRLAGVDLLVLSSFYVLRIVAGTAAIEVQLSKWLLPFSYFLFLSLALMKRYCEIPGQMPGASSSTGIRWTYDRRDVPLLMAASIGSG